MQTPKLTPVQQAAYDRIKAEGVLYMGNGVGIHTVKRLERLGLITITSALHVWTNYQSKRTHHQLDWSARPVA